MARILNIIGAGHVGRVLGRLFAQQGVFQIQDVLTRSKASACAAVEFIGAGRALASMHDMRPADVFLLAVGDDQIETMAQALGALAGPGVVAFHCSGALAASALQAMPGVQAASVHPVRSFADPAAVAANFGGTMCGVEGSAAALALLEPAFAAIGAQTLRINPAAKTLYHAASVFASNYLVTLMDAALRAYEAAGIEPQAARALAGPLASETLANVLRLGGPAALSGPVARGDWATVARQQEAVAAWDAPSGALYAALVKATGAVARNKISISSEGTP